MTELRFVVWITNSIALLSTNLSPGDLNRTKVRPSQLRPQLEGIQYSYVNFVLRLLYRNNRALDVAVRNISSSVSLCLFLASSGNLLCTKLSQWANARIPHKNRRRAFGPDCLASAEAFAAAVSRNPEIYDLVLSNAAFI